MAHSHISVINDKVKGSGWVVKGLIVSNAAGGGGGGILVAFCDEGPMRFHTVGRRMLPRDGAKVLNCAFKNDLA